MIFEEVFRGLEEPAAEIVMQYGLSIDGDRSRKTSDIRTAEDAMNRVRARLAADNVQLGDGEYISFEQYEADYETYWALRKYIEARKNEN